MYVSAHAKALCKDILVYSLEIQRIIFHSFAVFGTETIFSRWLVGGPLILRTLIEGHYVTIIPDKQISRSIGKFNTTFFPSWLVIGK
jgi:hypothetical protein